MAKLLITGGSGFIGSHTCLVLLKANHSLVVIDNFSNSSPILLELVYPKVYTSTLNQDISANIFRPSNDHSYDFYYDTSTDILVLQSTRSNLMPSVKDGLDYVLTRTPENLFNVRGRLLQKESDGNYLFFLSFFLNFLLPQGFDEDHHRIVSLAAVFLFAHL